MDIHSAMVAERRQLYERAQGSPLYSAPRKNINPSATGGHIQEEVAEVTRWVNRYLSLAGHSDQLVTELVVDMADGITLLRLVEAVASESLPRHFPNPMMKVQKLENFQMCLQFLRQKGIPLTGVHNEDIAGGNLKSILAVCQALKRHFTSPKNGTMAGPHEGRVLRSNKLSFSSLNREDMALLAWMGEVVHRPIPDYTALHDGKVLCELMNEVQEGAIPEREIATKSREERLKMAFAAGEQHLFIPQGSVDIARVPTGQEDGRLKAYLVQCKLIYQHIDARRQAQRQRERGSRKQHQPKSPTREVFESLRTSTATSKMESREAAKIALRSYEGIKQKKMSAGENQDRLARPDRPPPRPLSSPPPRPLSSPPPPLSSSSETLPSSTAPPPNRSHSTSHIPTHSTHHQPHSTQPVHVSSSFSYSDLTSRTQHQNLKPMVKHSSTEGLQSFPQGGLQPMKYSSMDSGLASRQRASAPKSLASSWGGGRSGYDSDSIVMATHKTTHEREERSTLPRRSMSTGPPSPTSPSPPPPPLSAPPPLFRARSTELMNQPTFEPFGGRMAPRRSGSYSRLDSNTVDELSSQISDLQERVSVLTTQFLFEKADMFKQLKQTLVKERKKRQAVERRLQQLEKTAQQFVSHYDSCFVELAKDVASLRAELEQGGRGTPSQLQGSPYIAREMDSIKQQLSTLTQQLQARSHKLSPQAELSVAVPKASAKQTFFLRKRANSDTVLPHGPYLKGSTASFRKLSNFFGEEPPRLEDLESFLDELGYSYLLPTFQAHHISLAELCHLEHSHLEKLGIPLGPRARILSELQQLLPLDNVSEVI